MIDIEIICHLPSVDDNYIDNLLDLLYKNFEIPKSFVFGGVGFGYNTITRLATFYILPELYCRQTELIRILKEQGCLNISVRQYTI